MSRPRTKHTTRNGVEGKICTNPAHVWWAPNRELDGWMPLQAFDRSSAAPDDLNYRCKACTNKHLHRLNIYRCPSILHYQREEGFVQTWMETERTSNFDDEILEAEILG